MTKSGTKQLTRFALYGAWIGGIALVAILVSGCGRSTHRAAAKFDPHAGSVFSDSQMNSILRATATAASTTPADTLVADGRRLFRSTSVAKQGQSCNTCHVDGGSGGELSVIVHPTKAGDFTGDRTALPLWNVSKTGPWGWQGNTPTLQAFTARVVGNFFKTGATQSADVTAKQVAALVAYMNTLSPPVSPFDTGAMSDAAKRGQAVFMAKCASCHTPPLFTDGLNHDIGVPNINGATDPGVGPGGTGFNTPQLRDVANKTPYFHNGMFTTLDEVVTFYDGQSTLDIQLSGPEKADLVEFLRSL